LTLGNRERRTYAGLAALLVIIWLATLGLRPLFNPDEGRYAEIPREMLAGGDWIIPHLDGLAYIEKPPLQYWATALSLAVFGHNEFAARLYAALCALGTLALVYLIGTRLWSEDSGWRASAVLCAMLIFLALGQLLTLDMSLTFYLILSLAGFLLAQGETASARRWMLLGWMGAALGVLTKGLVAAAIPAAVLVLYSLCSRDFSPWRRLHLKWGLPLFLVVTIPWHWLAAQRLSDFLQFFFVHEHFARYLTPIADREEPWWFFGWVFLAGTLPWTLPTLRVLLGGWRERTASPGKFNARFFLWLWVIFVVVFFSWSDSKLMPYILPVMPPLALLIGTLPATTLKRDFLITAILTVSVGAALLVASLYWSDLIPASSRAVYFLQLAKPVREIAAVLLVSGVFVAVQRKREATRDCVFLGVGWCLAWLLLIRAAAILAPIYSGVGLAAALTPTDGDAPLYSVRTYDQTLPFYLRRTVTPVAYRGELSFGLGKAPQKSIADIGEFIRVWTGEPRGFAVMRKDTFKELKERELPMRIVGENVDYVVVARQ
jgi:4-amino-4-deoxy-L-arabinose transferase-like glycosyltransferase